jgi:hypothetical protein
LFIPQILPLHPPSTLLPSPPCALLHPFFVQANGE